ncbi:anthrone oxygenase family protein [Arthrobacter sp. 2RAF6]|uniref:anthrone oxygenase family protein n=1 Tax=Arthrobacter sp. 2RAF6 TaxID=3233002 RepID=UPI003F901D35
MKRGAIQSVARVAVLLFVGLFAGFLVGVLILELSLRQFDGTVYAQLQQVALIGLPVLASVLLFPALIATAALVVMELKTKNRGFWLVAAALALLLAALITTLVVNVPINLAEGGWNVRNPPADWADMRDRWQLGHALRTFAAVAAFGALSVAAVQQPIRRRSLPGAPA